MASGESKARLVAGSAWYIYVCVGVCAHFCVLVCVEYMKVESERVLHLGTNYRYHFITIKSKTKREKVKSG